MNKTKTKVNNEILKLRIRRTGLSLSQVSKLLNMKYSTFNSKLNNFNPFTQEEKEKIEVILNSQSMEM
jgi:hypothetical protein